MTQPTPEPAQSGPIRSELAHAAVADLVAGRTLDATRTEALFDDLLAGKLDDAQIGAVLALIQARGVAHEELLGAARVMRRRVTRVPFEAGTGETLIDTCGTGGAAKTFNISTAAAIVAASATPSPESGLTRVVVAKHGNRSRTGRGSAEVLAELGINLDASPEVQAACLREVGVCFCFAIKHHPAMRFAAGPRKSLGVPTVFNLLGPLTNPAGAARQMIGVYRAEFVELVARTLAGLGAQAGLVAHSADGMDELSTAGANSVAWVEGGSVRTETIDGSAFGLESAGPDELRAGDVGEAAGLVRTALDGSSARHRDVVLLNAGAALVVAGATGSIGDGIERARAAVESGAAVRTLESLVRVSNNA
ncbi:MAG: anthranilate phosphoribosyltransferase [Planctomycetota bacterium]